MIKRRRLSVWLNTVTYGIVSALELKVETREVFNSFALIASNAMLLDVVVTSRASYHTTN